MVKISNFHFSDFMQKGASLPASQLLKVITRGRISRLSADSMLEFFRPLEAWLESQNRDETVSLYLLFCFAFCSQLFERMHSQIVGWSSNMDDVQLFQNLALNEASSSLTAMTLYIFSFTITAIVL